MAFDDRLTDRRPEPLIRDPEEERAVERRMHDRDASMVEKSLMALSGAAEGLAEQIRTARLRESARAATHKLTESFRQTREGFREGMGEPQGDGQGATTGGNTAQVAPDRPSRLEKIEKNVQQGIDSGVTRAERAAEAVGKAAGRAAEAPAAIQHEVKTAAKDFIKEARGALVAGAALGLLAFFGILFTSWFVVQLINEFLGDPWGTLIVAILYLIGAVVAYSVMKKNVKAARHEAKTGIRDVKAEARHEAQAVARPLRDGFGTRRGA